MEKYKVLIDGTGHDNKSYKKGDIIEVNDNDMMKSLVKEGKVEKID